MSIIQRRKTYNIKEILCATEQIFIKCVFKYYTALLNYLNDNKIGEKTKLEEIINLSNYLIMFINEFGFDYTNLNEYVTKNCCEVKSFCIILVDYLMDSSCLYDLTKKLLRLNISNELVYEIFKYNLNNKLFLYDKDFIHIIYEHLNNINKSLSEGLMENLDSISMKIIEEILKILKTYIVFSVFQTNEMNLIFKDTLFPIINSIFINFKSNDIVIIKIFCDLCESYVGRTGLTLVFLISSFYPKACKMLLEVNNISFTKAISSFLFVLLIQVRDKCKFTFNLYKEETKKYLDLNLLVNLINEGDDIGSEINNLYRLLKDN